MAARTSKTSRVVVKAKVARAQRVTVAKAASSKVRSSAVLGRRRKAA